METLEPAVLIRAMLVAAGLGAAVGLERQIGRSDIAVGARTFALFAIWGAAAGYAGDRYGGAAFVAMTLVFGALVVAWYLVEAQRTKDVGTTTEAAALVVFVIGLLSWSGQFVTALALAVGTAALIGSKDVLHGLGRRLSDEDARSVLQFGVITAVVLPVVPDQNLGPFGALNPREVWLMVVLVSAIGLAGYVALRIYGQRGLSLTGVLGGIVSSTAVTLGFSRMSRTAPDTAPALAAGVLGASALMYPRVLVEAGVIDQGFSRRLAPVITILFVLVGLAAGYWWRHRRHDVGDGDLQLDNPLSLKVALQFGALYGLVILVSKALLETVSDQSLYLVGIVSGIADVDAITLSTANLVADGLDPRVGAQAVVLAVITNTALKGLLVAALGSGRLRRAVTTVLLPTALVGLALVWTL